MTGIGRPAAGRPALWTRWFVLLLAIDLVAYNAHFMLLTGLPTFVAGVGGSTAEAGVLAGAFTFAALGFRPLAGKFLDERGRRVVLVVGAALITLCSALYPFLSVFGLLFLLRVAHGAGYGAFTTASGTVLADLAPASRLTEAIGYLGVAGTISTALGPPLGLYLLRQDVRWLFGALVASGVLVVGLSLLVRYERKAAAAGTAALTESPAVLPAAAEDTAPEAAHEAAAAPEAPAAPAAPAKRRGRLVEPSAVWIALFSFFTCLPLDAIMMYIATYGKDRGFAHIDLFFPVHAVGMGLTYLFLGRIVDRVGPKRLFLPSLAVVLATYGMLAFARSEAVVFIASFLFGVGLGLSGAVMRDFLIRIAPRDALGAANATYMTASDLGFGLGSVAFGFLLQALGFTAFFLVSIAVTAASGVVYYGRVRAQLDRHDAKAAAEKEGPPA